MSETNFEKVCEFNEIFGGGNNLYTQFGLIAEEFAEVVREIPNAMYAGDMELLLSEKEVNERVGRLVKELVDLLYVTYGMFYTLGVDADKAFNMVHASNMSKLGKDGKPVYREDGKILKGPDYKPVDPAALYEEAKL